MSNNLKHCVPVFLILCLLTGCTGTWGPDCAPLSGLLRDDVRRSACQGDKDAQLAMAKIKLAAGKDKQALHWFKEAAAADTGRSAIYVKGSGLTC